MFFGVFLFSDKVFYSLPGILILLLCSWDYRHEAPWPTYLLKGGLITILPGFPISASKVTEITGMSHCAQPCVSPSPLSLQWHSHTSPPGHLPALQACLCPGLTTRVCVWLCLSLAGEPPHHPIAWGLVPSLSKGLLPQRLQPPLPHPQRECP
jgi:hypothetical protein